jgi:general secretion pathway protein G
MQAQNNGEPDGARMDSHAARSPVDLRSDGVRAAEWFSSDAPSSGQSWSDQSFSRQRSGRGRRCGRQGFTLVELLVVISLISILAAMGLVQYRNSVRHGQESVLKTDLFRMRDAIDQYYADKGKYPASLDALVSDGYLRKIPEDPVTKANDWQTVPAEPDPNNPSAEPGIYNVKSNATGTALDGTNYADW